MNRASSWLCSLASPRLPVGLLRQIPLVAALLWGPACAKDTAGLRPASPVAGKTGEANAQGQSAGPIDASDGVGEATQLRSDLDGCIVVASTNDIHGAIEPTTLQVGEHRLRRDGIMILSGYVAQLRRRFGDRLLLVDGGDLFQGTLASNLSHGRAIIEALGLLEYDAAAVGNHEFDFGGGSDHLAVIKARIAEAPFPFLAVNIFAASTNAPVQWKNLRGSMLMNKGGMKIGVIGVSTPETPRTTRPEYVASLRFPAPAPLVAASAAALRAQGAKLVVVVAHMGSGCSRLDDANDVSSCDLDDELPALLRALPAGAVDVAIGGHTHALVAHWINGVATLEAGSHARKIGWIRACAKETGGLDRARSAIVAPRDLCWDAWADDNTCDLRQDPVTVQPAYFLDGRIKPRSDVVAAMTPYLESVASESNRNIGVRLPTPLRRQARSDEQNLGVWIANALRLAAQTQFGLQNLGGVRADLPAGPLTYGQIYTVLPFGNQVSRLRLTGLQLQRLLTHMARRRQGKLPYLAGLRARWDADQALHLEVEEHGAPVKADAIYTLGTNDFLSSGGGGLDRILAPQEGEPAVEIQSTGLSIDDALIALLRQHHPHNAPPQTH